MELRFSDYELVSTVAYQIGVASGALQVSAILVCWFVCLFCSSRAQFPSGGQAKIYYVVPEFSIWSNYGPGVLVQKS